MRINTMKIAWVLTILGFVGILWWIWKYRIFEKAEEYQIIPDEWNHGVQPFREPRREYAREPEIRGYEPTPTPISTPILTPTQDVYHPITDQPATKRAIAGASWLGRTAPIWDITVKGPSDIPTRTLRR